MFRIIGAVTVIITAGFIGIKKYGEFYERKRLLLIMRDGAEKIRGNLKCMCMPLYECFIHGGEFFEKAAKRISEGELPSSAVKISCDRLCQLTKEDRDALHSAMRILKSEHFNTTQALEEIEKTIEPNKYVQKMVEFIRTSKRGVGLRTNKKAFFASLGE